MYQNENLPNPFQLILAQLYSLERKLGDLIRDKGAVKAVAHGDDLLTVQHASEFLRISASTLYQLTSGHEIPFMKRGKRLYFNREELRQCLEEGSIRPVSPQE